MNSTHLDIARQRLLAPAGMDEGDLGKVFGQLLGHAVDSGDLYFQSTRFESWVLEDGIVKEGTHSIEQGAGVRAISGDKTGFAYSDEIMMPALLQASTAARAIARHGNEGKLQAWRTAGENLLYPAIDPLDRMTADDKVALLKGIDAEARQQDPRVKEVIVSLAGVHEVMMVAASDGTLAADVRPLVRCNVTVIVEQDGRREQGTPAAVDVPITVSLLMTTVPVVMRARRCARHWSTWRRSMRRPARCRSCWDPAGPVSCCTRPSVTGWRAISTARAPRPSRLVGEQVASPAVHGGR